MFSFRLSARFLQSRVKLNEIKSNGLRHYAVAANSITKDDKRDFMAAFPDIVRDLTNDKYGDMPEVKHWFSKVLQHNVSSMGKRLRGLSIVYSCKSLSKHMTDEELRLSHILGWCVEMLQAFLVVTGDVMDESGTRKGRIAWHENQQVGMSAINDALLIQSGIFDLLKIHFRDKPYYADLLELFHDTILKTEFGNSLDLMSAKAARQGDLSLFTMDRYNAMVKYRTSLYTFVLPVFLSMRMFGFTDSEHYRQAKGVLLETGRFFQIQDDYIDVFGDSVTGKIGSDIRNGKCTWLAVVALQRSSKAQIEEMRQCYGSSEPDKINRIRELYLTLNLPAVYTAYEEENYNMINNSIQQLSRGLPQDLFFNLLENLYKNPK